MRPSLLLTSDFPPSAGSVARALGELVRHFPPGSLVVSTGAVPGADAVDSSLPVPVDRLLVPAARLRTLGGLLFWSRRVATLAREIAPGFLWCGNLRPAAYPAKWTRERLGVPYGILVHGADLLALQHRLHQSRVKRRTVRSLVESASVVVANSGWTRERCAVVLGELGLEASSDRVRVVPLGTDPVHFRPGLATDAVRRRYGLEAGRWLLTVATPAALEEVAVTMRALATLREEFADLHYAVVGRGEHPVALARLAGELGVADRVRFLPQVPDGDLPALYNVAAVYVGVARQAGMDVEGFGLSVLEGSACAVPVVVGRSGGMPDVVREGETGVLVDPESPEAVAAALRDLLARPDRGRELGEGGRRAVETFYNWSRVAADLRAISAAFRLDRSPAPRS